MKRRFLIPLLLAPALLLGLWRILSGPAADAPRPKWAPVRAETVGRTLTEIGVLEPKTLSRVTFDISGVIAEVIEDGSRVEAGDLLLRMDDEELREEIDQQIEALDQKREELEGERAEYAVLTNSYETVARKEIAELRHAELKLKQGLQPLTPEETRLQEIGIALAELDLEDARHQLERQRELVEKNFAAESSLEVPKREMEAAETFLREKHSQFELARQPLPEEERLTLQSEVNKARDTVERSGKRHQRQLEILDLKINGLELQTEHMEEKLEKLRKERDRVNLYAPTGGVFRLTRRYVWSARSWQPLSVGQQVWSMDILGTIVDTSQLTLRVLVHESDILSVTPGQKTGVTLTAFPSDTVEGVVRSVTALGQDRSELSPLYRKASPTGQALFLAQIDIDIGDVRAMPGMTARVDIELEPPRERVLIPREALNGLDPPFRVVRRRDGIVEDIEVTGRFDAQGRFEVTKGVRVGDEVRVHRDKKDERP